MSAMSQGYAQTRTLGTADGPRSAAGTIVGERSARAALRADLDRLLTGARPRLLRLARAHGVTRADADDAVQDTLLVAWRRLEHLRSPERLDAWLDGICRHVSQHYVRSDQTRARRLIGISDAPTEDAARDGGPLGAAELPDPEAFDPTEDLHRQDLETLLDRALGSISAGARELVERCYLEDLPQREIAARMGLTLGALELRLHRTRRELRRILSGPLRTDAEAFGLVLDDEPSHGWRETREWCNFCGRHRLRGTFEPLPDGRVNFRLRCPDCSQRFGGDVYSTGGMVPLAGARSFRPALKRLITFLKHRYAQDYTQALHQGWHGCPSCGQRVPVRLVEPGHNLAVFPHQWCLTFACSSCGNITSPAAFACYWGNPRVAPVALQFIEAHPRWLMEPDALNSCAGQPAIHFRLVDLAGRAQLTIFADTRTLHVLTLSQV
jgi:RNA polymerase sigma-70 factor (ECF subfamily)